MNRIYVLAKIKKEFVKSVKRHLFEIEVRAFVLHAIEWRTPNNFNDEKTHNYIF